MNVSAPDHAKATSSAGGVPHAWRQIALITGAALALYAAFRLMPTGTNLNHMDFRVEGKNTLEMCDPSNPQFIPVVAVRSPVSLALATAAPAIAGAPVQATVRLATASGKPLAPNDLLVMHTRRLHLLIADPTLTDYQHVHPEATETAGEWAFAFTPRFSGGYRVFADFTPAATGRGLYAHADLEVAASSGQPARTDDGRKAGPITDWTYTTPDGYRFALRPASESVRAGQVTDLAFTVERDDGGAVPLEPVMDAYAHLVAFDEARSGFAHLHPNEIDLSHQPDAVHPRLTFQVTIPRPGRYVVWAQVNLGGRETFAPFWFDVAP